MRGYLDETTPTDWTNAELNVLINQRYQRIYGAIIAVFEDYYLTTANVDTVAEQQEYTSSDGLPTDIYKMRRVEINYASTGGSPTRALPISNIDFVRRDLGYENAAIGTYSSSNAHYYLVGYGSNATLGFIPIPQEARTDGIKLWYVAEISDLDDDADTFNIPYVDRYYHLLVEGATADALRFGQQDSPEADKLDGKFDTGLGLMQQELEDRIAEETKFVMDVTGEFIDFATPRL